MKRHIKKPTSPDKRPETNPNPMPVRPGRSGGTRRDVEPEPIVIPPQWIPRRRWGRRAHWRLLGKAALIVVAFVLMSLPFVLNHVEHGSFYYQEVEDTLPVVLDPETPPALPFAEFPEPISPADPPQVAPQDVDDLPTDLGTQPPAETPSN